MPFPQFDRSQLRILPLGERIHDIHRDKILNLPEGPRIPFEHPALPTLAERIVDAAKNDRAILFICGAHVLRQGNGALLIDLMQRGLLKHLALNGAGAIHDFELAMIGRRHRPGTTQASVRSSYKPKKNGHTLRHGRALRRSPARSNALEYRVSLGTSESGTPGASIELGSGDAGVPGASGHAWGWELLVGGDPPIDSAPPTVRWV